METFKLELARSMGVLTSDIHFVYSEFDEEQPINPSIHQSLNL